MDVTVYYGTTGAMAGAVERLTTPVESEWDRCIAQFVQDEEKNLCKLEVRVEVVDSVKKKLAWKRKSVLSHNCGSMEEYFEWLRENVAYIEVDGHVFWANSDGDGEPDIWI